MSLAVDGAGLYNMPQLWVIAVSLKVDGGVTFSEPTAMVYGTVEGMENVSERRMQAGRE